MTLLIIWSQILYLLTGKSIQRQVLPKMGSNNKMLVGKCIYEGGSESSVIGSVTLLIDMIDCFIIWQVMKYREICIKYNQYLKKLYFHM